MRSPSIASFVPLPHVQCCTVLQQPFGAISLSYLGLLCMSEHHSTAFNPRRSCAPSPLCAQVIDTTFPVSEGPGGLRTALDRIAAEAEAGVAAGYSFLVLSDRNFGPERAPVSSLLALGCVHHHLVHLKMRSRVGLFVESGEARELHQVRKC
eukprot:1138089-Pelagomonas_calceolata.AAC.13